MAAHLILQWNMAKPKHVLWQVTIELTTLGLCDLRAANCATATLVSHDGCDIQILMYTSQAREGTEQDTVACKGDVCRTCAHHGTRRTEATELARTMGQGSMGLLQLCRH